MKIRMLRIEKIANKSKKYKKKVQKKFNKVFDALREYLRAAHFYRQFTYCNKCERYSDQMREDGSFSMQIHKKVSICSFNMTLGCALRSLLNYFVKSDVQESLVDICKESIFDINQFLDNLKSCN